MASQIKTLAAIKSNILFSGMDASTIKVSVNQKDVLNINEGDIIFQNTEPADRIYLLLEGEVKIKYSTVVEGQKIFIKHPGDFFGEAEYLEGIARRSSAVAQINSLIFVLKKKELDDLIAKHPAILTNLQGLKEIPQLKTIIEEPDESFMTDFQTPPTDSTKEESLPTDGFSLHSTTTEEFQKYFPDSVEQFSTETESEEPPAIGEEKTFSFDDLESLYSPKEPEEFDLSKYEEKELNLSGDDQFGEASSQFDEAFGDKTDNLDAIKDELEAAEKEFLSKIKEKKVPPDGLGNDQLKMLIEAAKIVNSNVTIDEVLNSIVNAATSLTNADRGTLYIFDREKGELWSRIIRGENIEEIRLKLGQGIAGWVAENGETVNLEDVSADERFDSRTDLMTGYETKSMLCFPIKNKDELTVGVLQLINSSKGKFLQTDEDLLAALSAHAAIALENASLVQQLLRNDRITYLGKVANFIISDLRKPILTIKHYAEHIKKKNITPDIRQVLDMIVEQTTNIIGLVQTTLSYSEGKTILQTKVQSLNTVMDEILEMLAEYVESMNVKLFKKYGKDVYVKVDKKELYQALFQITKNACEAMPEGGNFYISTAPEENSVTLSFKDIGLGIPPALKERVFEPFMTHGKKNGVGLGLPLAEKIIKEHGGEITIESEVGEGANFIVKLPIYS